MHNAFLKGKVTPNGALLAVFLLFISLSAAELPTNLQSALVLASAAERLKNHNACAGVQGEVLKAISGH